MSIFKITPLFTSSVDMTKIFKDVLKMFVSNISPDTVPIVKKSSAHNGGKGVFISGHTPKHHIVSLYPGCFEPPPPPLAVGGVAIGDLYVSLDDLSLKSKSDYRIHCNSCGGYLDAAQSPKGVDNRFPVGLESYLVGHMINHPPKGVRPNVFPVDFYWKDFLAYAEKHADAKEQAQAEKVVRELNNIGTDGVWYVDPVTLESVPLKVDCAPKVGIVIVASDDIPGKKEGTELWMDYRFNPRGELPPWYVPVEN